MVNDGQPGEAGRDTRGRILDAAAAAIAERGWGAVSTRAIAERAGVNNALIHYYFGSRQQLLRAAAIDGVLRAFQPAEQILAGARTLSEALVGMVGWIRDGSVDRRETRLLAETMLAASRDETLRAALAGALAGLRATLAARLSAETPPSAELDAESAAIVLAAALDGLLLHYLLDSTLDLERAAAALAALLRAPAAQGGRDEHAG